MSKSRRKIFCIDCGKTVIPWCPQDMEIRGVVLCEKCDAGREMDSYLAASATRSLPTPDQPPIKREDTNETVN